MDKWDEIPEGHLPDPPSLNIGTINFSDSINEQEISGNSRFNAKKSIGECKIEVYNGEGPVPHFHISNKDGSFKSCVRIYENMYFSHGGKYKDTLNHYQCKELDKWLSNKYSTFATRWQFISDLWNNMNPDCNYPKHKMVTNQPKYSDMEYFRDEI